jgi:hypothetical protein
MAVTTVTTQAAEDFRALPTATVMEQTLAPLSVAATIFTWVISPLARLLRYSTLTFT